VFPGLEVTAMRRWQISRCSVEGTMIPYDDITEAADRSWTLRLLERLVAPDLPDKEVEDLVGALQAVSDQRSIGPLEAVVCDSAQPTRTREAASSVLRGMQFLVPDVPDARLRRWWRDGDAVLRRHALLSMDAFDCPDFVLAVASDPGHSFHADALGQMAVDFNLPGHEEVKIVALAHPDPRVRETAATILFWDEPVRAEGPLIEATRDPAPEVVVEACKTLMYYRSLRTAACLHGLLDHPEEQVRQEAEASFADIRHEFLLGLRSPEPHVVRHVRHWLEPIWGLLAFTAEELRPDRGHALPAPTPGPGEPPLLVKLLGMLADPGASPKALRESLWRIGWRGYTVEERGRIRPVLLGHADPLVREEAALAFEAWQDADGLLALVRDDDFGVRKAAMYRLGQLPPTPGVAELGWEHLHRPDALGVHATETLGTFVRHAEPAVAVRRLGVIAGDHGRREELRVAAVHHLANLGAGEEMGQLVGVLHEPPTVTWALHLAMLDAIMRLGLPRPDLRHLWDVDNFYVQEAVATDGP
jgi:hypothetical protein